MGSVWKAEDTLLGRAVAIKVLADDLAEAEESRRRFRREGEIAAQFDHPGICPVLEAGEQNGLAYLVMALVDGETLSERIARRLMPVDDVLRIGRMATDALDHAHRRGVVHRDVTSRNIMLASDGRVVLLDFGLAIVSDASRITGPGAVVGTIAYMAPELLCGQDATPRSDIYSLGVVLYEMLSGARPFHAENAEALRYLVLQETPRPVHELRPETPAVLGACVMQAMARIADARFETAAEMLEALRACTPASGSAQTEAPARPSPVTVRPSYAARPDSVAETAPMANGSPRSLAARIASGAQPVYLAVLPVEDAATQPDAERARVLADLAATAGSALSDLHRVHVVTPDAGAGDLRARARRAGANVVLETRARADGSMLRITFALIDPETGARIGGGTVDGSTIQPFRLEDRFVEAVAKILRGPGAAARRRTAQSDPAARDRYAQALSYLERFDNEASLHEAVRLLEGLLASEGESATVLAALARAHVALHALTRGRDHEARASGYCDRALASDPEAPETLLALAELHLSSGRADAALAECDRLLEVKPDAFDGLIARTRVLDVLGRPEEAERALVRALALRPVDWRGHHHRALRAYVAGRYGEAIEGWRRATELCPDNAGAWRNLGAALGQADQMEDSVEAFRRSIAIRPNASAYWNLGTAMFYLRRYDASCEALEQAVALNPADAVAWGNLGNACRFIPGREGRAGEALERAIALGRETLAADPHAAETWARLAGWLSNMGCHAEAIRSAGRALELAPRDVAAMARAGFVHLAAGDRGRALHWLGEAVHHGHGIETLRRAPEIQELAEDAEFQRILNRGVSDAP